PPLHSLQGHGFLDQTPMLLHETAHAAESCREAAARRRSNSRIGRFTAAVRRREERDMAELELTVRFLRHGTDDGVECLEESIGFAERRWSVPAEQSALVMVDCWAEHFIRSHEAASGRIIREILVPAVEVARAAGITIIHAPS